MRMTQLELAHGRVQICRINQPPCTQFRAHTLRQPLTRTIPPFSPLLHQDSTGEIRWPPTESCRTCRRQAGRAGTIQQLYATVYQGYWTICHTLHSDPKRAIVPRRRSALLVPTVPTRAMYLATCCVGNFGNFDTLD